MCCTSAPYLKYPITKLITGGKYTISPTGNFGEGRTNNNFTYSDLAGNTYKRHVIAENSKITFDEIGGNLAGASVPSRSASEEVKMGDPAPRVPGRLT